MPLRVRLKTSERSRVRVKGIGGGSKLGDGKKSRSREEAKRLGTKNAPKGMDTNGDSLKRGRKEKNESSLVVRKGKVGSFNTGSKKKTKNAEFSDRIEGGKPRVKGGKSFEISKKRIRAKGKGVDEIAPSGQSKRSAKNMALEECKKSEGDVDPVEEQKIYRSPSRVLDKTGKKIRVSRKGSSDESNAETSAPKKRKRVIKLDPYDISNKRLDDTPRQSGLYFPFSKCCFIFVVTVFQPVSS